MIQTENLGVLPVSKSKYYIVERVNQDKSVLINTKAHFTSVTF